MLSALRATVAASCLGALSVRLAGEHDLLKVEAVQGVLQGVGRVEALVAGVEKGFALGSDYVQGSFSHGGEVVVAPGGVGPGLGDGCWRDDDVVALPAYEAVLLSGGAEALVVLGVGGSR